MRAPPGRDLARDYGYAAREEFARVAWGFIWLMFVLKIPIFMLLGIVWWAARQEPEPEGSSGEGGIRRHPHRRPPRRPRGPRRDPHGAPAPSAPPRMRTSAHRARTLHDA
jgi:hypothetical protein